MTPQVIKLVFFGLIALAVVFEVVGDIFFKKWSLEGKNILLATGLFVYFIGTVFWAVSLKYELLSRAVSIFMVLNLIAIVLVGVIYFKDNLSLVNKIGIGLAVLSIILIEA